MNIRAVIFDVYKTLLAVGPPPAEADKRWTSLWEELLSCPPSLGLAECAAACDAVILREHAAARTSGVKNPEIYWPSILEEALPELSRLTKAGREEFMFRHAQLQRTVALMPGAVPVLSTLKDHDLPLGVASNSQPYTLRELDGALAVAGLDRSIFEPALCFWSFENGFSKPDPNVFQLLAARLKPRGIGPSEILMVGDREDNDIAPALAAGWQTWLLTSDTAGSHAGSGTWAELHARLRTKPGATQISAHTTS